MAENMPLPASETPSAPPIAGGAERVAGEDGAPRPWLTDGEGYPPEAGLDGIGLPPEPIAPPTSEEEFEGDIDPEGSNIGSEIRSLWDSAGTHLDELRRRLFVAILVFAPLFCLGMYLYQPLWDLVIRPLDRAAPHLARFQALGPSDGLVMAMRLAFAFAFFISLPLLLGEVWLFVSPGLTAIEKRWLYLALGSGGVLFVIGAAMAYFVGVPFALEYLLPFNQSLRGWENSFTGPEYVDFLLTCCAGFGFAFELPLVMLVLGWVGILTPEGLRAWWRPAILVIFVIAAILTPPDPFTQLLMALPMLGLFYLGYWLVKWTQRGDV